MRSRYQVPRCPYPPFETAAKPDPADTEKVTYPFGNIDDYTVSTRIGRGKYSNVFKGRDKDNNLCVVKVLKPVRISKINREIDILNRLKGGPYISQLKDVVFDQDSHSIALILNWSKNYDIKYIIEKLTLHDIAIYTYKVLCALDYAHKHGIMHRDIKPGNIMFDFETKDLCVIDWGLADEYRPDAEYQVRVATKHYKGPELLLGYKKYTPALDIWCLGCTLASMLFGRVPFFRGNEQSEQIKKICQVLGGAPMIQYAKKYDLLDALDPHQLKSLAALRKRDWAEQLPKDSQVCLEDYIQVFDLLDKMLIIDHEQRITTEEALHHPFFDQIRS